LGAAAVGLFLAACATAPSPGPDPAATGDFRFERDAFAFPNLVRAQRPGWNDGFANYCLVMARGAAQFHRFARFAPDRPPASAAEYDRLVRQVLARPAWDPPAPDAERIVIPGYAGLREFSAAHEELLKESFGSNVLSMVHWRTWRVGVDFPPEHQERLARDLVVEIREGRPAPLMITNFPHEDILNHAVLVYGRRPGGLPEAEGIEFLAYDPNDPGTPFPLYYDDASRGFWVGPLTYSPPGRVRAFRLYTSPLF
ncbi:MAG: hypothetical protein ACREJR_11480, partial [Candidatus Rokuibacteriota bacterium]